MIIYDYANAPVEVGLPAGKTEKDIAKIYVHVLSGDETGYALFKDGSALDFDASTDRFEGYDDGRYYVTGDAVARWLAFKPENGLVASYERQRKFKGEE